MESSSPPPSPSVDKSYFYDMIEHTINADPGSLESELLEAMQDGDVRDLKELVSEMDKEDRANLADMYICGSGLLHVAAYLAKVEVCKYFVEELGFDVNAADLCGVTPLSSAALFGEEVVARYFLDHGADPNKIEKSGSVALHNAAKNGNEEVVRLLLSRGARVDIAIAHGTPLHIAASYGKTSVLKILLDHHADPNRVSEVSGTPLVTALHSTKHGLSGSDSLKCVKLLVKAGADVNSANPNTPLVVATTCGLTDCIKYLLEAGANPNISDKQQGRMPIQMAASFGRRSHVEILFPFTFPIRAVSNWTVEGIIAHEKLRCSIPKDEFCSKIMDRIAELKSQAKKAVNRNDFLGASNLYTKALALNYFDETLYSNRSFCYLKIGKAREALFDADICIAKRPEWMKGYYRKGAAHMSLKEYEEAVEAFQNGLELDRENAELKEVLREACEAMLKDHAAGGSIKSAD